jgi:hypothetical protein
MGCILPISQMTALHSRVRSTQAPTQAQTQAQTQTQTQNLLPSALLPQASQLAHQPLPIGMQRVAIAIG